MTPAPPSPGELDPFFALSLELLAVLTPDGQLTRVNPALADALGYSPDELVGRAWLSLAHPDDLAGARTEWERLERGISELRHEHRCVCQNGGARALAWVARRVPGHEALYLQATDLTRRAGAQPSFEAIFQLAPIPMILAGQDGRFLDVNHSFIEALGYPRDEILGETAVSLGMVDDATRSAIVDEMRRHGRVRGFEITARTAAGEIRDVAEYVEMIQLDGRPCSLAMFMDVTDLRRAERDQRRDCERLREAVEALQREVAARVAAEEDLRAQERFLDSVIENIPTMVFVKDAAGLRYVRINRAGEEIIGYARSDLLGKTDHDLVSGPEADATVRTDREVLAGGVLVDIPSKPFPTKHRGTRLLHTRKVPLVGDDGQPRYLLGISEDITDLEAMRSALLQSEKLASIGLLSAGIAHEINNPLAFVANNLFVLERDTRGLLALVDVHERAREALGQVDPEAAARALALAEEIDLPHVRDNLGKILARTREGVKRVTRIVDSMRSLARSDLPSSEPVKLSDLVDLGLELIRGRLQRRGIRVELDFGPDATVPCVPTQMGQVMLNLLTNAMHAVEATGRPEGGSIRVTCVRRGEELCLEVADDGCGVPPRDLPRIFDPFFTTKPVGEGMGLGLSITHSIVAGHGGRIEVESEPGEGSRFRVLLPAAPKRGPA